MVFEEFFGIFKTVFVHLIILNQSIEYYQKRIEVTCLLLIHVEEKPVFGIYEIIGFK